MIINFIIGSARFFQFPISTSRPEGRQQGAMAPRGPSSCRSSGEALAIVWAGSWGTLRRKQEPVRWLISSRPDQLDRCYNTRAARKLAAPSEDCLLRGFRATPIHWRLSEGSMLEAQAAPKAKSGQPKGTECGRRASKYGRGAPRRLARGERVARTNEGGRKSIEGEDKKVSSAGRGVFRLVRLGAST